MKLAEALQERADLKRNLNSLRERLEHVVLVQEGEKPVEDPQELLKIQDACFQRMEYLIAAINHSNDVIEVNGMTLTQLIAKKDVLLLKLGSYKNMIREAGYHHPEDLCEVHRGGGYGAAVAASPAAKRDGSPFPA